MEKHIFSGHALKSGLPPGFDIPRAAIFGAHGAPYDPAQAVGCAVRTIFGGKHRRQPGKIFLRANLPHKSRPTSLAPQLSID